MNDNDMSEFELFCIVLMASCAMGFMVILGLNS